MCPSYHISALWKSKNPVWYEIIPNMFTREQRRFLFKTIFCVGCGYLLHSLIFNGNDVRTRYLDFPDKQLTNIGSVKWSERQRRVEEYCRNNKNNLRKYQSKRRNVFHVSHLSLNFCLVRKAASASLSHAIVPHLRLNKKPSGRQYPWLQAEVLALGGEYRRFLQDNQTLTPTFLITRHPFARWVFIIEVI